MTTSSDDPVQSLFDALITASDDEFNVLKEQIKAYSETYHHSWAAANEYPFLGKLIDAIEEAIKYRTEVRTEIAN